MLIAKVVAIAALLNAVFFFFEAWLGFHWNKTKSKSELTSMMSTEGRIGESLTGAGQVRALILYPNRLLAIGVFLSALSLTAWIFVVANSP